MTPMRKRVTIAIAGATALGFGVASAASLGLVSSETLGAGDVVVASCDTNGVALAYTNAYSAGTYNTTGVTVSGIASTCDTKQLSVTLRDASNNAIGTGTATITGGGIQLVSLAVPANAAAVVGASVIITG